VLGSIFSLRIIIIIIIIIIITSSHSAFSLRSALHDQEFLPHISIFAPCKTKLLRALAERENSPP